MYSMMKKAQNKTCAAKDTLSGCFSFSLEGNEKKSEMCSILKLIELKCPFWVHMCNALSERLKHLKAGRITSNREYKSRNRKARCLVKLMKGKKTQRQKGPVDP